ncbi:ABC transporter substrate-binding protein [Marinobacter lutaoensis]|jgi:branched-chain amino acid transport system substrate-binding protein|uniref:ABC transporter substrate-binding protein n=1 Tax=Marinobacter lutaoensis TaxID=135739 RepID=A0A1V2DPY0_9GAMM|nr:ABC transporter substrate-binding protein [Marinobacter lutaoensis]MBE01672.1 ABC transporter substrate-binding protein [Marinobacter sp.]MBI43547.1 ABC transporter substrate-binding protein [Oceanospirillales bacterium]ONF42694.1 ABC transporter substrate-binding protein [Marinobacter lutaoensis]|tara:strand:- start:2448 stop:3596 length:1149 start_codon:yes stop_codon:yes gene_type:complete
MFKTMMRRAVALVAAAGLAMAAQAAEPIKIGSFLSVTGPASFLGDPELKTLEMYIEKINEDGGVLGRPLELVHYDDVGNASSARNFASRLIRSDRVDIIVGGSTTGATMAVAPLVQQAKIPFISLAGAVVITDPVKPWVFKTPQSDRMAAERILGDMKARGITRIGLISGTGGFGSSGRAQTLEVARDMGIEVLADVTYSGSDTDMTAQLTNIRNTEGVQAVLNFGFGQGPAIVTRNYAQLGIDLPFYQSHGVASDSFLALAGEAAEGLRLPASPLLVPDSLPDDDPQKAIVQKYKSEYEARWNSKVSTFGGYAYDGLMLAVKAIEAAGSTDPEAVREALENIRGYVGVTGEFNMSPDDHNGLDADSFRILEVQDGGWKLIN